MAKIVADSSALILLAKCGLLDVLCRAHQVLVPSSVVAEVASEELVEKYPDAALIADLIASEQMAIQEPEEFGVQLRVALDQGETDAILLARELQEVVLATDDRKAIRTARFLNIPFIITPRIVIDLFKANQVPVEDARKAIEKLKVFGRYSRDIIADALLSLTED